ncbi:hypothetical protein [Kingella kingae]|uniref:hypothetical protein n=1 Tax=Kingella kingae TaxID=504 RepID=UPI0003F80806|nr:hypothetical protein [Kingella kingae]
MNTRLFLSALCLTSAPLLYAQSASAPSLSVSQIIQNEIDQTWQSSDFVPTEIEPISASSTESAPTTRPVLQPHTRYTPRVQAATEVTLPSKPTRRQILQQEINRERQALAAARVRLSVAQKRNNAAAVQGAWAQIQDREGNIAALELEASR